MSQLVLSSLAHYYQKHEMVTVHAYMSIAIAESDPFELSYADWPASLTLLQLLSEPYTNASRNKVCKLKLLQDPLFSPR